MPYYNGDLERDPNLENYPRSAYAYTEESEGLTKAIVEEHHGSTMHYRQT